MVKITALPWTLSAERQQSWFRYTFINSGLAFSGACIFLLLVSGRHGAVRVFGIFLFIAVVSILIKNLLTGKSQAGIRISELRNVKAARQKNEQELAEFIASKKKGQQ